MWLQLWLLITCANGSTLQSLHQSPIYGSTTTTRSDFPPTRRNTHVNYVDDPDSACSFIKLLCRPCSPLPDSTVAMFSTSVSLINGPWTGRRKHTLADPFRLHVSLFFLQMRLNYTSGVLCTSQAGFRESGRKGYLLQGNGLIFTAWIRTSHAPHMLPYCPGRVGRRWRFRFLPTAPRRRRRRKHVKLYRAATRFMRRLWNTTVHTPTADECPQHVLLVILSCFQCYSDMLVRPLMHVLHSRLQHGVRWGLALVWAQTQTRRNCSDSMASESGHASDSEEIERRMAPGLRDHDHGPAPTTPGGTPLPRGPPPAATCPRRATGYFAQALGCYRPCDVRTRHIPTPDSNTAAGELATLGLHHGADWTANAGTGISPQHRELR